VRRKHSRSSQLICRIDVSAFLSIQVALLAMFMVHVSAVRHYGVSEALAEINHPTPTPRAYEEGAILVAVHRDGKVFFGQDRISPEFLPDKIRQAVRQGSERKIYIKADARARYGDVSKVLESVRSAGVENIAFLVEQRKPQPVPWTSPRHPAAYSPTSNPSSAAV
jgi:biopolymer transport protein TolR